MTRLLPLLCLALVPAVVAAPVPRDVRPSFGDNGLLKPADLAKVRFDSRLIKLDDGERARAKEEEAVEKDPEDRVKRGEDKAEPPQWSKSPNRFDVAVYMPWTKFREGEPIHAYFVLRNNRDEKLGLRSCIDLSSRYPELHGGAASFDIRDRATGKSVLRMLSASTNCGGGSLVDVPAYGFHVLRGELNWVAGHNLPPGEYEVQWEYFPIRSAPVRFTVMKSEAKPAPLAKREELHSFHLFEGGMQAKELDYADEPFLWRGCDFEGQYPASMAAALSVGQHGVYAPDVRAIPMSDGVVEAWAEWRHYREGDRLVVTLRSSPAHAEVWFDDLPQFYLQIEGPEGHRGPYSYCTCRDQKKAERDDSRLVTPLTIEMRFPADWREQVGVADTGRVSVLVVAKELEMPRRGNVQRLEKDKRAIRLKRLDLDPPPLWSGVVRTNSKELQFPPPPSDKVTYLRIEDLPDTPAKPGD